VGLRSRRQGLLLSNRQLGQPERRIIFEVCGSEQRPRNPKGHAGDITAPLSVTKSVALPPDPRGYTTCQNHIFGPNHHLSRLNGPAPKCTQTRMSLVGIAPGPKGFDIRTFECSKCEYVHIISIEHDPMKSARAGWQHSHLKPPD
jgi:hypothetical protein